MAVPLFLWEMQRNGRIFVKRQGKRGVTPRILSQIEVWGGQGVIFLSEEKLQQYFSGWYNSISWGDTIVFLEGDGGSLTRNMRRKIVVSKRLRVESVVDRHSFLAHHWILILDNSSSLYSTLELTLLETLVKVHIFNTTSLSFCPDRENPALR